MGDLIELKPNVSKDKQECFEDLIKEVSKHKIKGFIVLVETEDDEAKYVYATSSMSISMIGSLEEIKYRFLRDFNEDIEDNEHD